MQKRAEAFKDYKEAALLDMMMKVILYLQLMIYKRLLIELNGCLKDIKKYLTWNLRLGNESKKDKATEKKNQAITG